MSTGSTEMSRGSSSFGFGSLLNGSASAAASTPYGSSNTGLQRLILTGMVPGLLPRTPSLPSMGRRVTIELEGLGKASVRTQAIVAQLAPAPSASTGFISRMINQPKKHKAVEDLENAQASLAEATEHFKAAEEKLLAPASEVESSAKNQTNPADAIAKLTSSYTPHIVQLQTIVRQIRDNLSDEKAFEISSLIQKHDKATSDASANEAALQNLRPLIIEYRAALEKRIAEDRKHPLDPESIEKTKALCLYVFSRILPPAIVQEEINCLQQERQERITVFEEILKQWNQTVLNGLKVRSRIEILAPIVEVERVQLRPMHKHFQPGSTQLLFSRLGKTLESLGKERETLKEKYISAGKQSHAFQHAALDLKYDRFLSDAKEYKALLMQVLDKLEKVNPIDKKVSNHPLFIDCEPATEEALQKLSEARNRELQKTKKLLITTWNGFCLKVTTEQAEFNLLQTIAYLHPEMQSLENEFTALKTKIDQLKNLSQASHIENLASLNQQLLDVQQELQALKATRANLWRKANPADAYFAASSNSADHVSLNSSGGIKRTHSDENDFLKIKFTDLKTPLLQSNLTFANELIGERSASIEEALNAILIQANAARKDLWSQQCQQRDALYALVTTCESQLEMIQWIQKLEPQFLSIKNRCVLELGNLMDAQSKPTPAQHKAAIDRAVEFSTTIAAILNNGHAAFEMKYALDKNSLLATLDQVEKISIAQQESTNVSLFNNLGLTSEDPNQTLALQQRLNDERVELIASFKMMKNIAEQTKQSMLVVLKRMEQVYTAHKDNPEVQSDFSKAYKIPCSVA